MAQTENEVGLFQISAPFGLTKQPFLSGADGLDPDLEPRVDRGRGRDETFLRRQQMSISGRGRIALDGGILDNCGRTLRASAL